MGVLTEPAKAGEVSIFVETKIGMPGDKIMVDGEMNEVGPDAEDAKEPPEPPAKKGAEIKLVLPLSSDHAPGSPVKIVKAEEKKEEEKKKEEKKKEEKKKEQKKKEEKKKDEKKEEKKK